MNDKNENRSLVYLVSELEISITDARRTLENVLSLLTGENIVEKPCPVTACSMLTDMQVLDFRAKELAEMATRVNAIIGGEEE